MTALSPEAALATLAALVLDWEGAIRHPKTAKAVILRNHAFADRFVADMVGEMLLCGGNWRRAVRSVPAPWRAVNKTRLGKFSRWAENLTRRPVRGLLVWKGGGL